MCKISESFEELASYSPIPQNEFDAIEDKTIENLNMMSQRFGKATER
jgi:hypothetical protein